MTALDWLGQLGNELMKFLPRPTILCENQAGVYWRFGCNPQLKKAGWYLWWPLVSEFDIVDIAWDTIPLSHQTIKTADDKALGVSGWLTFRVSGPVEIVRDYTDYIETLQETAAGTLSEVMSDVVYNQINYRALCKTLRDELQSKFDGYIELREFALADIQPIEYPLGMWTNSTS